MDRRTFLTSGATTALLAGCTIMADSRDESPGESEGTPTDGSESSSRGPTGWRNDQTVVDFETAPLTATVPQNWFRTEGRIYGIIDVSEPATADSPAKLVMQVENRQEFEQTLRSRWLPGFDSPSRGRTDDRNVAYLAPTTDHELVEYSPDYERDDDGRWRLDRSSLRRDWFPETLTLGPGEVIDGEYHLLAHSDRENPPVTAGRYRFGRRDNGFYVVTWPTDEPGPDGGSRFADVELPDLPDGSEEGETAWYHDAGPGTEQFIEPSAEYVSAPGKIEFDLVNHGRESMGGNPFYWRLYKFVDETWYPIAPWGWNLPAGSVPPGGIDETTLALYHGESIRCRGSRTVGYLGGGRYAYTVDYSAGPESHAAVFDLDAPELTAKPEEDAEIVDEGERLIVRLPNHEDTRYPATLTVMRTETADERIIPEQLPRSPFRAAQNTIPLFEPGVETVRLETDERTAIRPVGGDGGTMRFEYEGRAFEAVGEVVE